MPCKAAICIGLFAAAILSKPLHAQTAAPSGGGAAALYEQGPNERAINRYIGSVSWRTERVSPGAGQPPDVAIRADAIIPKRGVSMTWVIRRNSDKTLPASHLVEIMFKLPAKPPHGNVVDVSATHMKQGENTPGTALSGRGVKVTDGFYMIGLSSTEAHQVLNIQLLTERPWLDVGFIYENGTRAMFAVEKGDAGKRVFAEAFAVWAKAVSPKLR
jgi:hypothetical protein